eukprot:4535119-Prymnesium_polylepis.1
MTTGSDVHTGRIPPPRSGRPAVQRRLPGTRLKVHTTVHTSRLPHPATIAPRLEARFFLGDGSAKAKSAESAVHTESVLPHPTRCEGRADAESGDAYLAELVGSLREYNMVQNPTVLHIVPPRSPRAAPQPRPRPGWAPCVPCMLPPSARAAGRS